MRNLLMTLMLLAFLPTLTNAQGIMHCKPGGYTYDEIMNFVFLPQWKRDTFMMKQDPQVESYVAKVNETVNLEFTKHNIKFVTGPQNFKWIMDSARVQRVNAYPYENSHIGRNNMVEMYTAKDTLYNAWVTTLWGIKIGILKLECGQPVRFHLPVEIQQDVPDLTNGGSNTTSGGGSDPGNAGKPNGEPDLKNSQSQGEEPELKGTPLPGANSTETKMQSGSSSISTKVEGTGNTVNNYQNNYFGGTQPQSQYVDSKPAYDDQVIHHTPECEKYNEHRRNYKCICDADIQIYRSRGRFGLGLGLLAGVSNGSRFGYNRPSCNTVTGYTRNSSMPASFNYGDRKFRLGMNGQFVMGGPGSAD